MEFAADSGPWIPNVQPGQLVKIGGSLEFTWPRRRTTLPAGAGGRLVLTKSTIQTWPGLNVTAGTGSHR